MVSKIEKETIMKQRRTIWMVKMKNGTKPILETFVFPPIAGILEVIQGMDCLTLIVADVGNEYQVTADEI